MILARELVSYGSVEEMEASMSPDEYEEWLWSVEYDPPATGLLRVTNALLSQLLAVYHNVNFTDSNKEHLKLTAADFLRDPDDEDDDEAEESTVDEAAADAALAIALAANPLGAIATGHGLVMGSGSPLPAGVLGAFFKGASE